MRGALYAALKALYPVYHHGSPSKKDGMPYLIMGSSGQVKTSGGRWNMLFVHVISPAGDWKTLDEASAAVIAALNQRRLERVVNGGTFLVQFDHYGAEYINNDLTAIIRPLIFKIPSFGGDHL